MSMRLINESRESGGRCGDDRESPSDRLGITDALAYY